MDGDDAVTTYKGITNYTVDTANGEQMRLTYRGGLTESKKTKQTRRSARGFRGLFGPFGGPRGIPSPFARPTFAGKTQTTNRITITPRGNVLAMEGDSQLPYLLGNVSLLPFETLPRGNERDWSFDSGVSITEESENRRQPFGPFGPFAGQGRKNIQTASEVAHYTIESVDGDHVTIKRSYHLKTPQTDDNPAFDMSGTGTWTFDQKSHIPHALDMKYKLTVKNGNTSTTIPISVKYTHISAAEIAKIETITKQKMEERTRAAAVAKEEAEAPLTDSEKREAMSALASSDVAQIQKTLGQLAAKAPKDPDLEVAAAIEKLLASENKGIASLAHQALVKWSPAYKLKKSLAKAYQGPGVLKQTGLAVESTTPLYVGQIVQSQRRNRGSFWFAAKVQELLADGTVKLGFLTWGKVRDTEVVARRNIQLAPKELEQPAKPVDSATASNKSRTWSDATGQFKIEAVFVGVAGEKVNLRRADNRVIAVPLERLSAADQAHIQQLQKAKNPFAVD
ncbi:MAG: SHD1 domain-containing protein [Pirellulaceae bacterium]|nr:SHD1 domain-containing protein [Pirellulaceae bacterium]